MKNNKELLHGVEGFVIGGIAGGVIALLLAPESGEETRHDINKYMRLARMKSRRLISDARVKSKELTKRAAEIKAKSKEFAEGRYMGSAESLEKEIKSLRAGLEKAINTYKNYYAETATPDNMIDEIFVDFNKNEPEQELNPKHEGMGKRY
jgi:gas vesicle protein